MIKLYVEPAGGTLEHIFEILRYLAFVGFFTLCLWLVSAYLYNASPVLLLAGSAAVVSIAVVSWWNIRWSLFVFMMCIPLVSGLFQVGLLPVNPLSFWFACIYLTWFIKRVFVDRQYVRSRSIIGDLTDTLSAMIIISLIVIVLQYPGDYVLYRLWSYPPMTQNDKMFSLFSAFILLQGLFLYRITAIEVTGEKTWSRFTVVFYVHVVTVLVFYLIQAVYNLPARFKGAIIYSPFGDVHSWGSYVVLLLFVFWGLSGAEGRVRICGRVVTILFACLILLSSSITTVAALLITGCIFIARTYGTRPFLYFFGVTFICLLLVNLYPSFIEKSNHYPVQRYVRRLVVKNIIHSQSPLYGRVMSADQALGIVREYPLTGSGTGTFYRVSRYYHYSDSPHPGRIENAHNYYLQFAADLGIPALLLFLSIIFFVCRSGIRNLARDTGCRNVRKGLVFGYGAYLFTMITGHSLILCSQQLLFWFVVAMLSIHWETSETRNLTPDSRHTEWRTDKARRPGARAGRSLR